MMLVVAELGDAPDCESGYLRVQTSSTNPKLKIRRKMKEEAKCSVCSEKVKPMIDSNPTWFGTYLSDKIIKVVCSECYGKGEREKIGASSNGKKIV